MSTFLALYCTLLSAVVAEPTGAAMPRLQPVVESQEDVYDFQSADNGAGPTWCHGSTCLVRIRNDVFASGIEKLEHQKPLNNCRWMLFKRNQNRWELQCKDAEGRTREPSPIVGFQDGRLFLSVNPTLTKPGTYAGPARPQILQFNASDPKTPVQTILPKWNGTPQFTEHSYRSFAADGVNNELILFQNIGYTHSEWAFRDAHGKWTANGKLPWPWGDQYDKPQPIRVCYPTVMLQHRAVHFCGVSDIMEPYLKWREFKHKLTGRHWDYDFRRLFYTWSDDITTGKFHKWVEIASRDKTAGNIFPCDLWIGPDGRVHVLWTERALDVRLRKEFFPDARQSNALNYAILRDGKILSKRALVLADEGGARLIASAARFQVAPGNRLLVFYYVSGTDSDGKTVSENRILELSKDGAPGESVRVPLERPFTSFFTATVRGGSPPSKTVELLGLRSGSQNTISYAKVRMW